MIVSVWVGVGGVRMCVCVGGVSVWVGVGGVKVRVGDSECVRRCRWSEDVGR